MFGGRCLIIEVVEPDGQKVTAVAYLAVLILHG